MTEIGFLLYPRLTQLDLTGPYEVLARLSDARAHLIWKTLDPVASDRGLAITPTATFATCPPLDVMCVPGGPGQVELMDGEEAMALQLALAYNPQPPFDAGSPDTAPAEIVESLRQRSAGFAEVRRAATLRAVARRRG